jgi:hypothetical protein
MLVGACVQEGAVGGRWVERRCGRLHKLDSEALDDLDLRGLRAVTRRP